jgi:hypothetical protein
MATLENAMNWKKLGAVVCGLSAGALVALAPASARADGPSPHAGIEGHIGIATPLLTATSDDTTSIADSFTLLHPIGIGFKLSDKAAIDFEMVLGNPIHPRGTTNLVVDPGIVYDIGSCVIGLRVAWKINADSNFGLIPLIHKGLFDIGGGANWFVEAAFPSFFNAGSDAGGDHNTLEFNVVLHTGIGF